MLKSGKAVKAVLETIAFVVLFLIFVLGIVAMTLVRVLLDTFSVKRKAM